MSAMDRLIRNQVEGVFGPEVARLLTPEGMSELGSKVSAIVERYEHMQRVIAANQAVLHTQNIAIMKALNIEPITGDGDSSSGSGGEQRGDAHAVSDTGSGDRAA